MFRLLFIILAVFVGGCDSDPADDPIEISDRGVDGDASMEPDFGELTDVGQIPDGVVDLPESGPVDAAPQPDSAPPGPVPDCATACTRIEVCGRTDVFSDLDSCLVACGAASRDEPPISFFECLEVESCNLLHLCRLPDPPPLSCQQMTSIYEECGDAPPFAPDAGCAVQNEAVQLALAECAQAFAVDCDRAAFQGCLVTTVFTECGQRCEQTVACNLEPAAGCIADCFGNIASSDPLRRFQTHRANECVRVSNNCHAVNSCVDPQLPTVPTEAQLCAAWDACGLDQTFPCSTVLSLANTDGARQCAFERLQSACPADPLALLACQGAALESACPLLCDSLEACGDQPIVCVANCEAAPRGETAAAIACTQAADCNALDACLQAASPADTCADRCGRIADCGVVDPTCQVRCEADFYFAREQAVTQCVNDADECEAVAACAQAPHPACQPECERVVGCEVDIAVSCRRRCDDAAFLAPDQALTQLGCIVSAPHCEAGESVRGCLEAPPAPNTCATYCAEAEDPVGCVVRCGEGYIGADLVTFLARPEPGCEDFCTPMVGCDLLEADCVDRCAVDPLLRSRASEASVCLGAAGENCEAVARCIQPDDTPIDVSDGAVCAVWNRCNLDQQIDCVAGLQLLGDNDAARACIIRRLETMCPADPFELLSCANEDPRLDACLTRCDQRALCEIDAVPRDDCRFSCVDAAFGPRDIEPLLACEAALHCEALGACLAP